MNIKNVLGIGFFLSLSIFSLYSMHESLQEQQQRLMNRILDNNLCAVQALLNEGLDPNFYGGRYSDRTPLQTAVYRNNYGIVEALLDHKANPNFTEEISGTPFHEPGTLGRPFYIAAMNNNISIMKLLIQRGANWRLHYNAIVYDQGTFIAEPTKRWLKEYVTPQPRGAE